MSGKIRCIVMLTALSTWFIQPTDTFADGEMPRRYIDSTDTEVVSCGTAETVRSNFVNLRVYPNEGVDQAEFSIAANPNNSLQLLVGSMGVIHYPYGKAYQGYYYSGDGGSSWIGADTLPGQVYRSADPAVAYDFDGNAFYCFLEGMGDERDLLIAKSSNGGQDWVFDRGLVARARYNPDKLHLAIDFLSESYKDNIYVAWTYSGYPEFSHYNIAFSRSTVDDWQLFPDAVSISKGLTTWLCHGVNLGVAPDGSLYAAWAIYDPDPGYPNGDVTEDGIGFNRSVDGGVNWWPEAVRIIDVEGTRTPPYELPLPPKEMRVNSFPVMAVDTAGGGKGTIYLVWADRRYGGGPGDYKDSDILLIKSTNGGDTWQWTNQPIRVNDDDSANGRDQWFPWVTVDPAGGVNVVFYDNRDDPDNYMTEVWVARSTDGGQSFENFRVGEVAFEPCPILSSGFMGDYIGITSTDEYVYACWTDNRVRPEGWDRGVYQAHVGVIPIKGISGNITSNMDWKLTALLTGDVVIDSGVTVTVKAGTKVLAASDSGQVRITVAGNLVIEGGEKRPTFLSDAEAPGGWWGIRVTSSGSVDWGDGCVISDAVIGVSLDEGASSSEIRGVKIENIDSIGFQLYESVRLINDTILGAASGYGIAIRQCDAVIDSSYILNCGYGVYISGSSGSLRGNVIEGSGTYGIYLETDPELPGQDTMAVIDNNVNGYFSGAHLYAGNYGHCRLDSCEFITTADSPSHPTVSKSIPMPG